MQEEITADCGCGFQQNWSITDHIFLICQILEKKKGSTMRQCIEFKEAYHLVRWEVLHNVLFEIGIPID